VTLGERELVAMLAFASALQALAIDAMLPALGVMAHDLGIDSENKRQLVIAVFFFGIGAGALLPGALADRFGRKTVLLGSLAIYIVTSIACALARDFTMLLVLRVIQALGSAGLMVLPAAIIRDRFEGDRMARLQSLMGMIFMIVPMIAPTLGQGVLVTLGWRWIFGMMGAIGMAMGLWIWMRLPETLHPQYRQSIAVGRIAGNMATVVTTRESIGYIFGSAVVMSATWGFINSSQQLIAEHFGMGRLFPFVFGAMASCMALASFVNSRIVERFGARRVSHTGVLVYIVVSLLQVWLSHRGGQSFWEFMPLMALNMGLAGFIGANFQSIALQPFARTAGAAASVQAFIRTATAAVLGAMIGQAYDGTARPLSNALLFGGVATLLLVLFSERGRLFRRLYPRNAERVRV